jgi:hypothetical protein
MRDTFRAVDAATEVRALIRDLRRRWEPMSAGGHTRGQVWPVVARSWSRMRGGGLDPTRLHPRPALDADPLDATRSFSPLRHALPALSRHLGAIAEDAEHVVVICDPVGRIL